METPKAQPRRDWTGSTFVKMVGETWLCANHAVMVAPAVGIG
jgi:hypothetical protein